MRLQSRVDFGEIEGHRRRAKCPEHGDAELARRDTDLETRETGRIGDRMRARGYLAESDIEDLVDRVQPGLLDLGADDGAKLAVHRRPDLIVAREGEAKRV